MSLAAFQVYLSTVYRSPSTGAPLSAATASDYPSRLRRLERTCNLQVTSASPEILRSIADTLKHDSRVSGVVPPAFITDVASALRAYAMFRDSAVDPDGAGAGATTRLRFQDAEKTLRALNFTQSATESDHIAEFRRGVLSLYAIKHPGCTIVVHPLFERFHSALARIARPGSRMPLRYFEHAALSRFPVRRGDRQAVHYGIPFWFTGATPLYAFVQALSASLGSQSGSESDMTFGEALETRETEAAVLTQARLGQGRFRAELVVMWQGTCPLSGVTMPEMLRASHIKPWRDSTNHERLDPCNGLLLAVHLDALFDRALITFRDNGEMIIANHLSRHERQAFGLDKPFRSVLLCQAHLGYLAHHRARFVANGCDE